ncbi:MAG: 4Fe-4S binding protein [Desulfobacteraceae bacterium]|nr:4Fe-4S binding protein [Desulfobacteraceae bacterium]
MATFTLRDRFILPSYDNPEQMRYGRLEFDPDKCSECGICVLVCPGGSLRSSRATKTELFQGEKTIGKCGPPEFDTANPEITLCVACFDCGAACPKDAIRIQTSFDPGYFYKRLTQIPEMKYPNPY